MSKRAWMDKHWPKEEVESCMRKLKEAMLAYLQDEREKEENPATSSPPTSTNLPNDRAALNVGGGFKGLQDLLASLNESLEPTSTAAPTQASMAGEDQDVSDRQKVEAEYLRYIADPIMTQPLDTSGILGWWYIHRHTYPLLWKVARDILPAQASAVPCERVFSSSKQTTTQQRNSINPGLMEKLQIIKFGLRVDRLDFTDDILRHGEDMIGGTDHFYEF
jgi:hAT family C-terminal dimerisation region